MTKRGRNFLMTPGPTTVPERVLAAMQHPAVDLIDPDFVKLTRSCLADLASVFRTEHEIFAYAANGHGAWEAALVNVLSQGDQVLAVESGVFSWAWASMADALGIEVETLPGDWRHAVDPNAVEDRLRADTGHSIKALLVVQTDTATSIATDVPAIRAAMDAAGHPALLLVDVVASLGTAEFRMDEWGVDVAVAASQKALMCPPGLSFNAVGPRAREAEARATLPRYYWDWQRRRGEEFYMIFCGTAPEHLLFGLREALDMVAEEGLEAMFARHARLAGVVRAAVEAWAQGGALDFNALEPSQRCDSVTTIRVDEGLDSNRIREFCRDRHDVSLGAGLGQLNRKAFRIAHMGYVNGPTLIGALGAVEATLEALDIPRGAGAVEAAVARLRADAGDPEPDSAPTTAGYLAG
jgi:alanine-glyoxylate transaminase/serine-glyoxylate transaminase/serine-pyruvate transaminase